MEITDPASGNRYHIVVCNIKKISRIEICLTILNPQESALLLVLTAKASLAKHIQIAILIKEHGFRIYKTACKSRAGICSRGDGVSISLIDDQYLGRPGTNRPVSHFLQTGNI